MTIIESLKNKMYINLGKECSGPHKAKIKRYKKYM